MLLLVPFFCYISEEVTTTWNFVYFPVVGCSGCYNKIPRTRAYKQQIFISHINGGWKSKFNCASMVSFHIWWEPPSQFICGHLFTVTSHGGRNYSGAVLASFIRVPFPFMRALVSWSNQFPQVPSPNIITLDIRIFTYACDAVGGAQTFSLKQTQTELRNKCIKK